MKRKVSIGERQRKGGALEDAVWKTGVSGMEGSQARLRRKADNPSRGLTWKWEE